MSKAVVFRCKQKNWNLAHEEVFHVGVVLTPYVGERWIGSEEQWETLQKLPDPEKVNSSYVFSEGVEHNELITSIQRHYRSSQNRASRDQITGRQ